LIPEEQYGFLRGKSTLQAVDVLLNFVSVALDSPRRPVYGVFIDFRKAFDSISRNRILDVLIELNVTGSILVLLNDILQSNMFAVFDGLQYSNLITQNTGVPQGDSMSPLLFVLVTVRLINGIRNQFPDVHVLMYADDAILYSYSISSLQDALGYFTTLAANVDLRINTDKTKCIKFRRGGRLACHDVLKLGNEMLEFVSTFTYLGVTLSSSGKCFTAHINSRVHKAIICAVSEIRNPRVLSVNAAIQLFYLKVAPIASYGVQIIWQFLTTANLHMLDRVKSMFLKRMLGVARTSRNRLVYLLTGCTTFIESLRRMYNLPITLAYEQYVSDLEEKYACIDADFFQTPAMLQLQWREPHQKLRHVLTRYSMHGFHFKICLNSYFHEASELCRCRFCGLVCEQYHFLKCHCNPLTLSAVAKE